MSKYRGITSPQFIIRRPFVWLWKRFMCTREMHAFDEVYSGCDDYLGHYLNCDVCGLVVGISAIMTEDESVEYIEKVEDQNDLKLVEGLVFIEPAGENHGSQSSR